MTDIAVRVSRARRDEIAGERDGRPLVRLTAPPVEAPRTPRCAGSWPARRHAARRVRIARGQCSRDKLVRVEGTTADELRPSPATGS